MSAKTHKGLAKRLKRSRNGKVSHRASGKAHLLSHKSAKRKRGLRQWRGMGKSEVAGLERQYGRI